MDACLSSGAANGERAQDAIPDGIYRGAFTDPKQVEVEFEIKDNAFVSFEFRSLTFREMNYKENEDAAIQAVGQQYLALGEYLVGKDFSAVKDLYTLPTLLPMWTASPPLPSAVAR